jgi:hypothetical protein
MGSGVEASTAAPSPAHVPQPAFGQYADYSELERAEPDTGEFAADRFARRIRLPAVVFLALLEVAWLAGLGYLFSRLFG